ncbi:hypothetical protein BOTCAL_0269g00050 [Botryotinia calthae]|uniref:Uncharacterized protein n=1 Tax=Botryotinia calthae TaxID=38488 RepID=A0A4Y8CY37_9HELO|nr:hypothetical protein BOTCAL_0269g00050 [Botryotinia calthae]
MIPNTEMLGAGNIIDITFGVISVILTMISIYLMCKHHNARVPELDIEQGRDSKLNPTMPDSDPASIPSYYYPQSFPMALNQAVVPFPIASQAGFSPSTQSFQTTSQNTPVQNQIPPQNPQCLPIPTNMATVSDHPNSHAYYHSFQSFFLNESG